MNPRRVRSAIHLAAVVIVSLACSSGGAAVSDGEVIRSDGELERALAANPKLRDAVKSIDAGHPWKATVVVAPMITGSSRNPAAVLIAARAAAGWDGWTEVNKLLSNEPWIDTLFDAEGRELLARASLGAPVDTSSVADAVRNAGLAFARAPAAIRPRRAVFFARALDRGSQPDSAAALYAEAAKGFPAIADWLRLREAGAEKDSADRARAFATVRTPAAKARVAWTDAQARERFGDLEGAASRYAVLGARVSALRVRFAMASDGDDKARIKDSMIVALRSAARDDARQIVQTLDGSSVSLAPRDELAIGRALSAVGPLARSVTGFDRANRAHLLSPDDRLQYGLALSRAGRSKDALAQLDSVTAPASIAGQAAYQRARLSMASSSPSTMTALRSVATRFAADTAAASSALYLLADLQTDAGTDDAAIGTYRELYRTYPTGSRADDARFRAAVLDLALGRTRAAALAFDSLVTIFPKSNERTAAQYWSGRAWKTIGDSKRATAQWQAVVADQPTSYYGMVSAKRLGGRSWKPAAGSAPKSTPAIDSAIARVAQLQSLGLDAEVRFELDGLEDRATTREAMLATASAFAAHGEPARAIRLALKLIDQGVRDASVYRLAFPMVDSDELRRQAAAQKLDPSLVAGLIRQESSFDPRAVSVANARGLMQLLPAVGAEIAKSLRYPVWNPVLLNDADVNLQLGSAHLASAVRQYGDITRVLAAYNAGGARVDRWSKKTGAGDPELFTEEIPFVETRDYVRAVQRNAAVYRGLEGK